MAAFISAVAGWCAFNVVAVAWCLAFEPKHEQRVSRVLDICVSLFVVCWGVWLLAKG